MQIRPVEFQENFGRAPVEGARQQSLLQREPQVGQQHAAQAAADELALNMNRPTPTAPSEGQTVDPNRQRSSEQRARERSPKRRSPAVQPRGGSEGSEQRGTGKGIDLVV